MSTAGKGSAVLSGTHPELGLLGFPNVEGIEAGVEERVAVWGKQHGQCVEPRRGAKRKVEQTEDREDGAGPSRPWAEPQQRDADDHHRKREHEHRSHDTDREDAEQRRVLSPQRWTAENA